VAQKSWDQYHLKANTTSYSQDFESLHLHAQIFFYSISKFTETIKTSLHLENKNKIGPDLPRNGPSHSDPAQICGHTRGRRDLNG
jgi:hypothetical protein